MRRLAADYNLIAVHRHDLADTETPVAAYWRLNQDRPGFLLESVEGGERLGRFSFIGGEPRAAVTMKDGVATVEAGGEVRQDSFTDPISYLETILADCHQAPDQSLAGRFSGGLVGYLAYEAARYFETIPAPRENSLDVADAVFFLSDNLVVFDHLLHRRTIIAHVRADPGVNIDAAYAEAVTRIEEMAERLDSGESPPGPDYAPNESDGGAWNVEADEFKAKVERCKEYILAGDILPGPGLAAADGADDRPSLLPLPGASHRKPVAVHVLPQAARARRRAPSGDRHRGDLAGDAGAGRRRPGCR